MTKLQKMKVSLSASIGIIVLVALIGVGLSVKAFYGNSAVTTVIEEAGGVTINNPVASGDVSVVDQSLGAVASPDVPYNYLSVNGDTTYHITGSFKDATTTILSFVNPFGTTATSTVDLVRLDTTGAATSTYSMSCGASATAYAADSVSLLDSVDTATSSVGILENNLTAALGGQDDAGTVEKIALTPTYPYFLCTATTLYPGAFTEVTNTYAGKFTVHVSKQR